LDVWKDGDDVILDRVTAQCSNGIAGDVADTVDKIPNVDSESVLQLNSPSPAPVDNEPANDVAVVNTESGVSKWSEVSSRITGMSDITLPKAYKVRGWPKGAGQTVIGQKRKKTGNSNAKKPKRQKHANANVESIDSICDAYAEMLLLLQ